MNRRDFLISAAAAAAAPAAIQAQEPDSWITIAHLGRNMNMHSYSPEALAKMARLCKGQIISSSFENDSLEHALGVVTDARLRDGELQVQVKWLQAVNPSGYFLTTWGASMAKWKSDPDGKSGEFYIEDGALALQGIVMTETSAFQRATKI